MLLPLADKKTIGDSPMRPKRCQYCLQQSLIELNGKCFCEECEMYYTLSNGRQEYSNLPIEEIEQMTVMEHLCRRCRQKYAGGGVIRCRTFREYFKKLSLCKKCKKSNERCIKNAFFKNFILYRTHGRIFGVQHVFFITLWFYLFRSSLAFKLLSVTIIDYQSKASSVLWTIGRLLFVCLLGQHSLGWIPVYAYCLFRLVLSRGWFYEVPVDLDRSPNLLLYIEQLKLGK
jgi:hypothetical protein